MNHPFLLSSRFLPIRGEADCPPCVVPCLHRDATYAEVVRNILSDRQAMRYTLARRCCRDIDSSPLTVQETCFMITHLLH